MAPVLIEAPTQPVLGLLPERSAALIEEGLRRGREIDCRGFVPREYAALYGMLEALPRGRFCEWGSGMGIATALAETLGYAARGIEIHEALAEASRGLLADFGFSAEVVTGSYFEVHREADVYFTYCWPGQMRRVEEHFVATAPDRARLVSCHGAAFPRCKEKAPGTHR